MTFFFFLVNYPFNILLFWSILSDMLLSGIH